MGTETGRHARLFDRFIESPYFQDRLTAQILRDSDEQAGAVKLAHVGDAHIVVGGEAADNLPAGAEDADVAVGGADEEAVGAGAGAGNLVGLEAGAGLVVVGQLDLADIEEVKRLPLLRRQRRLEGGGDCAWVAG